MCHACTTASARSRRHVTRVTGAYVCTILPVLRDNTYFLSGTRARWQTVLSSQRFQEITHTIDLVCSKSRCGGGGGRTEKNSAYMITRHSCLSSSHLWRASSLYDASHLSGLSSSFDKNRLRRENRLRGNLRSSNNFNFFPSDTDVYMTDVIF